MQAFSRKSTLGSLSTAYLGIYSCPTSLFLHVFGFVMYNGLWHFFTYCQRQHHCLFSNCLFCSLMIFVPFTHMGICAYFFTHAHYSQSLPHLVSQHLALLLHKCRICEHTQQLGLKTQFTRKTCSEFRSPLQASQPESPLRKYSCSSDFQRFIRG